MKRANEDADDIGRTVKRARYEECPWHDLLYADARKLVYAAAVPLAQRALALASKRDLAEARATGVVLSGARYPSGAYKAFLSDRAYWHVARRMMDAYGHSPDAAAAAAEHGDVHQLFCWHRMGNAISWSVLVPKMIANGHYSAMRAWASCVGAYVPTRDDVMCAITSHNVDMFHFVVDAYARANGGAVDILGETPYLSHAIHEKNTDVLDACIARSGRVPIEKELRHAIKFRAHRGNVPRVVVYVIERYTVVISRKMLRTATEGGKAELITYVFEYLLARGDDMVDAAGHALRNHLSRHYDDDLVLGIEYNSDLLLGVLHLLSLCAAHGIYNSVMSQDYTRSWHDSLDADVYVKVDGAPTHVRAYVSPLSQALWELGADEANTFAATLRARGIHINWVECVERISEDVISQCVLALINVAMDAGMKMTPLAMARIILEEPPLGTLRAAAGALPAGATLDAFSAVQMGYRARMEEIVKKTSCRERYDIIVAFMAIDNVPWLTTTRVPSMLHCGPREVVDAFLAETPRAVADSDLAENILRAAVRQGHAGAMDLAIRLGGLSGGKQWYKKNGRIMDHSFIELITRDDNVEFLRHCRRYLPVRAWTQRVLVQTALNDAVGCMRVMLEKDAVPNSDTIMTAARTMSLNVFKLLVVEQNDAPYLVDDERNPSGKALDAIYVKSLLKNTWDGLACVRALCAVIRARRWPSAYRPTKYLFDRPYLVDLLRAHGYEVHDEVARAYTALRALQRDETWDTTRRSPAEWSRVRKL